METRTILPQSDKRPSKTRSAVSNGRRSFVEGDGKSVWARRHRDLVELHMDDLGSADGLSEAQQSLCRRAATLEVQLEAAEGQLSLGKEINLDEYARVTGHLRRVLETLGVRRAVKTISNPLVDHFSRPYRPEAAE